MASRSQELNVFFKYTDPRGVVHLPGMYSVFFKEAPSALAPKVSLVFGLQLRAESPLLACGWLPSRLYLLGHFILRCLTTGPYQLLHSYQRSLNVLFSPIFRFLNNTYLFSPCQITYRKNLRSSEILLAISKTTLEEG